MALEKSLRLRAVERLFGLKRSTLPRLIQQEGKLPPPISIDTLASQFSVVLTWIEQRNRENRANGGVI
jgi:predicted DNA-binding transcriptional regulator AlpA